MSTTTEHETTITASADVPTIEIVREFEAPPERVFRAWTEPRQFAKWIGPRSLTTTIDRWDCETGGAYRYRQARDGEEVAAFFGSFHEVRPGERLVQTFTWEGQPDGVSLETVIFEALPGDRCRVVSLGVVESMALRDMIIASGMDTGVAEGYEKLDELLADR